ncbi:MAG: 1-deoxy-D-xylulose-5-phosphate reductoisomerase [candidate division WOR-3 bacterium]|nr:1-deoxy-D-xylulose-5-phosphate reductoisomerase [candidate division WOR-3 bacterium]MCX7836564.1 1-deoxy-D-xylulose-5-phosphate reductoisomerase [candidate division WOR-3 bacterium]MDW8113909.1 1-deoxy-D-xylulose-5-phosphate reductoisomerase [candidate division WOR-3 bacterium]
MKLNLAIIGSTGFLGRQALEVINKLKDKFNIFALSCEKNIDLLITQAKEYKPRYLQIYDFEAFKIFKKKNYYKNGKVVYGDDGLLEVVAHPEVEGVLFLAAKTKCLKALILAIEKKKKIALASKELIVAFGSPIFQLAKEKKNEIIPIDSELVALQSLLSKYGSNNLKRIFLTASGGYFFAYKKNLDKITAKEALKHPVWKMGKKITIDSATLINKVFEIIEASYFFELPIEKINVLIHPQGIIHGLIENYNGIIYGMLTKPDMKIFLSYALFKMINKEYNLFDNEIKEFPLNLTLIKPNKKVFPALELIKYLEKNTSQPSVLVGADEIAVENFLKGNIKFTDIIKIIKKTLKAHKKILNPSLKELIQVESWARYYANNLIKKMKKERK